MVGWGFLLEMEWFTASIPVSFKIQHPLGEGKAEDYQIPSFFLKTNPKIKNTVGEGFKPSRSKV
jgi:hypothetical protein